MMTLCRQMPGGADPQLAKVVRVPTKASAVRRSTVFRSDIAMEYATLGT